jgi:chemotaxis protein methyltransferase CheR
MAMVTPVIEEKRDAGAAAITPDNYAFLQQYIYRESGIVLDAGKQYLLDARLTPVAKEANATTLNDLCALLKATGGGKLKRAVVEAMTIHETLFFRDAAAFEALKTGILPQLKSLRASKSRLSIWSAAASSGQEAYSIGMMLLELGLGSWQIDILGTDLSHQILERAREGRYAQMEVNRGLPAPYLVKYFKRQGLGWEVSDQVRRMVRFQQLDLRQIPRMFGPFDLVLCRNVLIYFDMETKRKIVQAIHATMTPGSMLLLGSAETLLNVNSTLERKLAGTAAYYQMT